MRTRLTDQAPKHIKGRTTKTDEMCTQVIVEPAIIVVGSAQATKKNTAKYTAGRTPLFVLLRLATAPPANADSTQPIIVSILTPYRLVS